MDTTDHEQTRKRAPWLPRDQRRQQLLEVARQIVRENGTDRLTLAHLAEQAGVSKPVVYDQFGTLSGLIIALYRWLDMAKIDAFRDAMVGSRHNSDETVAMLAAAFVECAADIDGEVHAVGAAMTGSAEKEAVLRELHTHSVGMFQDVLAPHTDLSWAELNRICIGLVGSGDALAAAQTRGQATHAEAVATFASLIRGAVLRSKPNQPIEGCCFS